MSRRGPYKQYYSSNEHEVPRSTFYRKKGEIKYSEDEYDQEGNEQVFQNQESNEKVSDSLQLGFEYTLYIVIIVIVFTWM